MSIIELKNGYYVPMLAQSHNKRFCNGSHRIGSLIAYHKNIHSLFIFRQIFIF